MKVRVKRIKTESEHEDQKWIVIEGSIDGEPQLTKRRTISTSSLADGSLDIDDEIQKLKADVTEYHARWMAVTAAMLKLDKDEKDDADSGI